MSSDLQRDIEAVERVLMQAFRLDSDVDAWLRLKVRLTPDRENLTAVLQDAALSRAINIDHYDARLILDAAINAMRGRSD